MKLVKARQSLLIYNIIIDHHTREGILRFSHFLVYSILDTNHAHIFTLVLIALSSYKFQVCLNKSKCLARNHQF